MQRAALISSGPIITLQHLPDRFRTVKPETSCMLKIKMGTTLMEAEKGMIQKALELSNNNRTKAAAVLGITRRALYNKLKKHNIP